VTIELMSNRTIPWARPKNCPNFLDTLSLHTGLDEGDLALEVGTAYWSGTDSPPRDALLKLHKDRASHGIAPVVVVAINTDHAWIFGPNAQAAVIGPVAKDHAQRILQSALNEPSGLDARRNLNQTYEAVTATSSSGVSADALRGVGNAGLFATHELKNGVRKRSDWDEACSVSLEMMSLRKNELVKKLGYSLEDVGGNASLLKSKGANARAVAVILLDNETFDGQSNRFAVSPVAFGLQVADRKEVSWLIVLRKDAIRLYPARLDLGVGRKGLAETYFELNLAVTDDSTAGFLSLIFSAEALAEDGTCYEILKSSSQYAVGLSARLRDNVYGKIVPLLSLAVAAQLPNLGVPMDRDGLNRAYQITLRIFFRMLFQAYADDRKLLPYGENDDYTKNAIKSFAKNLIDHDVVEFDGESTSYWDDLEQVWHAIDTGSRRFGIPAYNGGLFSSDEELQPDGALIERLRLTDDIVGPVLRALLIDEDDDGTLGPIDFRSLSVREFGTIYEGLLESNLGFADTDLVLDDNDTWVPAPKGATLEPGRSAAKGTVYFHDTSGARKGSGSYFTPSFVVEHLLERSLDPALDAHLDRVRVVLESGDQVGAANLFFDFKVADIAMGSAHFLTAAIDHIEQRMAGFLDANPIPGVTNELRRLEAAAREKLGENASVPEPSSLLRRQIARRCIYGLDINPVSVELARVSIWIHTFVRGLPMSSLDHTLVCANSLTGIGTVDEALKVLIPGRKSGQIGLFDSVFEDALSKARDVLVEVAKASELDSKESKAASRATVKARKDAEEAKLLFDAAVLTSIGRGDLVAGGDPGAIARLAGGKDAQETLAPLNPAHMPLLFPEVFLRDNAGFDVLIGNPPWDKLRHEPTQFWVQKSPGLNSEPDRESAIARLRIENPLFAQEEEEEIANREQLRVALSSNYLLQGSGHSELAKFFAERNLRLLSQRGALGIVLPGPFCSLDGWKLLRKAFVDGKRLQVSQAENRGGFIFPNVHQQTTVALVTLSPDSRPQIWVEPGLVSRDCFPSREDGSLEVTALIDLDESAQIPWIGSRDSAEILQAMTRFPTLSSGDAWLSGEPESRWDFSGSGKHKTLWNDRHAPGSWEVLMARHVIPYGLSSREIKKFVSPSALDKLVDQGSIERVSDRVLHLQNSAQLVYRFPSSSTNTRTLIASPFPTAGYFYSTGYAHGIRLAAQASGSDALVLLGLMNSIPVDWWARTMVDRHVGSRIIRAIPVPAISSPNKTKIARSVLRLILEATSAQFVSDLRGVDKLVPARGKSEDLEAELDALVAHIYGLTREQVEHIFKTFHRNWDYQPRLTKVLAYFDTITKEKK
jgi:hypothetical protein